MKKIVCHGDSLTEGTDVDRNYTWPALLENELNIEVINKGIGGDTTGGLLSRFYIDVVQEQPKIVFIMGGTNDLWWDLEINMIQANVFAMACQARYYNIAPVVCTPLPLCMEKIQAKDMMPPLNGYEKFEVKMAQLVRALSDSAEQSDILCLNFYQTFMDHSGNVAGNYFQEDGLHPNQAGHLLMAKRTAGFLRAVFNFS